MAFSMIVGAELRQGSAQMRFAPGHDTAKALSPDREHEPFGVRVGRSRQLHPMVTVRIDVSESPTPSIRSSDANST